MAKSFKVAIIGAGPAGSSCGYFLSRAGIENVIFEKEKLPRQKVCAGGITSRIESLFDFDITCKIQNKIKNILFCWQDKEFLLSLDLPFIYTVERSEFDSYLVEQAVKKGTKLYDNTKVERVEKNTLYTTKGVFKADYIVDATGASCLLSRKKGFKRSWARTIQAWVKVPEDVLDRFREKIRADFSFVFPGWAWVFPRKDKLVVGTGFLDSFPRGKRKLKKVLLTYLDFLFPSGCRVLKVASSPINLFSGREKIAQDNFILIGEAGGFVDPLSGEGIFWAIKSAKLAADFLKESIVKGEKDCSFFGKIVEEKIYPHLRFFRFISSFFYRAPCFFFKQLEREKKIATSYLRMLRGEFDIPPFYLKKPLLSLPFLFVRFFRSF
ncbi:NAD(P)/FAD-dependent oxidoreductase [Candidatus Aerophobetes bacterium]|nr:NAD(P)/FAD-dependent oxidoreductase [Candidatus Aerophobetes bacterium]